MFDRTARVEDQYGRDRTIEQTRRGTNGCERNEASDEEEEGFHLGRGHENGSLQVRTKQEPIVYKQKDFRPKGELMIWGYHDEYSSAQAFYEYYSVLSDTGVFDIKEHSLWYAFHHHKDDLRFAKDEFTMQELSNFQFAIRGYAF